MGKHWEVGRPNSYIVLESIGIGSKSQIVYPDKPELKKDTLEHSVLAQVKPQSMLSSLLEEIRDVLIIHHRNEKQN